MDEVGGLVEPDSGHLAVGAAMAHAGTEPAALVPTGTAPTGMPPAGTASAGMAPPAAEAPAALPASDGPGSVQAGASARIEFGEFYADHYVALVRLATIMSGSADMAPDLVQDCFVGLHRHWSTVRDPLPYVRRSVVHACASHHRRVARARAVHPPYPADSELGADELDDALAKLPARQRAAVVLRFYGDLSDADIARALRCRPATVRSLVHRALADLRKVVEP